VYKPRPMKKRAIHIPPQSSHIKSKKNFKNGARFTNDARRTGDSVVQNETDPQPKGAGVQLRKDKRDKREEGNLATHPTVPTRCPTESPPKSHQSAVVDPLATVAPDTTAVVFQEPRLIVEALVVRKLSLDEMFLDFEGFSLQ